MSLNISLNLALVLALSLIGPAACNSQKAEQAEEENAGEESQSDAAPTRDNRNAQSGDAAFIKIFPDGEVVPTRGENTTVSAPAATPASAPAAGSSNTSVSEMPASAPAAPLEEAQSPAPIEGTAAPAPVSETEPTSETQPTTPVVETQPTPTDGDGSQPAPAPEPVVVQEPVPAPAPEPVVIQEPVPAPIPGEEAAPVKEYEDFTRPVLALNESTGSQIVSILPKENKSIVSIGKHSDFVAGPYMIMAKWSNDSKKVKVNVTSEQAKEKNCALDDKATDGDWKVLGIFYLTKNAKVVITNNKNSNYSVKNELLLKPVVADHLTSPSKFKCLGGQIDGHGLIALP